MTPAEQTTISPVIVGIRFQRIGKIYNFDASNSPDLKVGDFAVVDTTRGSQLGEVVQFVADPPSPPDGAWKPIQRKATPRDLVLRQIWKQKELEAVISCRARVAELGMQGIKIVGAEFSFDGERLSLLFSSETEGKTDTKKLRNAMQRSYPKSQVELHQVGPRDVAKLLGGMGACGLDNRCCSMCLTDFSPISIKMAKEQGISLTPTEITGMCGRLRCCLVYEYEQYVEARNKLPKRGTRVMTSIGEGKVVDIYPLRKSLLVEFIQGNSKEFMIDELELLSDARAAQNVEPPSTDPGTENVNEK